LATPLDSFNQDKKKEKTLLNEVSLVPSFYDAVIKTPIGKFGIRVEGKKVYETAFLLPEMPEFSPRSDVAHQVVKASQRYFQAPMAFDWPLLDHGTPFQDKGWEAITRIPVG
jgi:O6-methylguanine-DNA--protein-cysteine methyltransferase